MALEMFEPGKSTRASGTDVRSRLIGLDKRAFLWDGLVPTHGGLDGPLGGHRTWGSLFCGGGARVGNFLDVKSCWAGIGKVKTETASSVAQLYACLDCD